MSALTPEVEATYEVLQEMVGGMGSVYKVRHRLFGELRVIKVMHAALASDPNVQSRFLAEAKRGKPLQHRNIVQVFDCQMGSDGKPYLVMEYVDGVNLRDLARSSGPLAPSLVVDIGVQTLAALDYLHAHDLVHRDISPDNLMLARTPRGTPLVKLIDLGIAKSLQDTHALTQAGTFLGKLRYASPEQFNGEADARSDFYSLGVVLYELLTGEMPITGANTAALIRAHCRTPPRPFEETDPRHRVPEALRCVVMKALAKNPEERHANGTEFAEMLDRSLPSDTTEVVTPPGPTRINTSPRPAIAPPSVPTTVISQPGLGGLFPRGALIAAPIAAIAAFGATLIVEQLAARSHPVAVTMTRRAIAPARPAGSALAIVAPHETERAMQPAARTDASAEPLRSKPQSLPPKSAPPPNPLRPVIIEHRQVPVTPVASARPTASLDLREGDRRRRAALALSNTHAWRQAIEAWTAFIRDYAGVSAAADHAAYYNLGVAHEALRHWSDAAEAFENADRVDGTSGDTSNFIRLGRCYGKLGKWSDAASAYEHALRIDSDNAVARQGLLFALKQQPRGR